MRRALIIGATAIAAAGCGTTKIVTKTVHAAASTSPSQAAQSQAEQDLSAAAANAASNTSTTSTAPALMSCGDAVDLPNQTHCMLNGSVIIVAHTPSELRLPTLAAQIVGTRTSPTVSNGSGFTATAHGIFLIISLKVTNRTNAPATFGGIGATQSTLEIGGAGYTESFEAENTDDAQSFITQATPIQPGESETGDLVFDVPPSRAQKANSSPNNGLFVANFGDDLSNSIPPRSGFISMAAS